MTFCPSCGRPVEDTATFCPNCGYNLHTMPQVGQSPALPTAGRGDPLPSGSKQRPIGVTIIAVLDGLLGLLMLLAGGAFLGFESLMGLYGGMLGQYHRLFVGVGIVYVLVGLVTIFLAWGIWKGSGWAWSAALVLALISAILHILSFNLLLLAINVIVIVYLFQPNVRLYFGRS